MFPISTMPQKRIEGIKKGIEFWKANRTLDQKEVEKIIKRLENDIKVIANDNGM